MDRPTLHVLQSVIGDKLVNDRVLLRMGEQSPLVFDIEDWQAVRDSINTEFGRIEKFLGDV